MELKKSLIERFYTFCIRKDWHMVENLIHKLRELRGYKYYLSFHTSIGYCVNPYPRSMKDAQCYESLYREYFHYDEVRIVETKCLID